MVVAVSAAISGCNHDDTRSGIEPTGPAVLLFAAKEGSSWDIYVQRLATGERTNLTDTPETAAGDADDGSPVWSPDKTMIAYVSTADHGSDGITSEELFVMSSDGSEQRRLTRDDVADLQPQWTSDGRIAFTTCKFEADQPPSCKLDVIDPVGGERATLVDELGFDFGAALSPDGSQLAISRTDENLRPLGVFMRDLRSGDEKVVTEGFGAAWSPDGKWIAFLSDRDQNGRCLFHDCTGFAPEVYLAKADGTAQRRLTKNPESENFAGWTPDGKWVLVTRIPAEEDDYDVYAVRTDGDCEVQVTDTEAWEWSPVWVGRTDSLSC